MRYLIIVGLLLSFSAAFAAEVNLYSARKETLIKPLLEDFTKLSGIKVNIISAGADVLISRLLSEGKHTSADVLLTVDAARLHRAKQNGLFQAVSSPILQQAIPLAYRDIDNQWFGLSTRARVIVYAKERVAQTELSSYMQLADPSWRRRLCVRSSTNIYNQSLVADLILRYGQEATGQWAKQLVANFARDPKGGDRDQIKAVAAGLCDVALVNTYYLAGMLHSSRADAVAAAQQVSIFWPDQNGAGTHVNISGAGVLRYAKNVSEAVQFLEYLLSDRAQTLYAELNYEYPIKADIALPETLADWGTFMRSEQYIKALGAQNPDAVLLMDKAGWQ